MGLPPPWRGTSALSLMLTGALCDDLLYFRRPTVDTADNHVSTSAQRGSANDSDPKEAAVIYRSSGSGLTGDRAIVYIYVANPIPQSHNPSPVLV